MKNYFFKQIGFIANYWNVTKRKNIHRKMQETDVEYFIQTSDYFKTFYITNNIQKHSFTKRAGYPEDIIYIPELKHDLRKLDKIDKIYIHSYLLKFYATTEGVRKNYNWWESLNYVYEQTKKDDWFILLRRLRKRFPEFSKDFNRDNLFKWASDIYQEDKFGPYDTSKNW
ncbi:hypothetical protein [Mycoplasma procyoni]|uniref:hypothetical protein n=1 Tax=Mycoplasma procyoni TaxID=568784 RepID=UPI00197BB407|nr:hypothetical protein [Mycoplasma procyoni]MBN3534639.1 hypothetical protein [Mycoplasma procyoni]